MCKKFVCLILASILICGCVACKSEVDPWVESGLAEGSSLNGPESVADTTNIADSGSETKHTTVADGSAATTNTTARENSAVTLNTTTKKISGTTGVAAKPTIPSVQRWVASEMDFVSDKEYDTPVYEVDLDVVFTHSKSGKTLKIPAFWDGGKCWTVRFALTEIGEWSWKTLCTDEGNEGLHGQSGEVTCTAYTGDLAIYQHGFLRTEKGKRYFMYADGTPFFYLGDTHWSLPMEELDGTGGLQEDIAKSKGITSQFEYIMDYRAEQGYTVIQSQQLAVYAGFTGNSWMGDSVGTIYNYGVNDLILDKFQTLDRYFAYIAKKGFVHSHTQFSYPEELIEVWLRSASIFTEDELEKLCRYWVARYCAYPVMWATSQEGDNDYYEWIGCTSETNPWKMVLEYVAQYDPYDHPSTCHQENTGGTRVNNSAFKDLPSHSWYAAQWSFNYGDGSFLDWTMLKEYWNDPGAKPVVNYEGRYDHYWTGTFGSRAQGWAAFMNGQFGIGYGVQPIWNLFWAGNDAEPPTSDGIENYDSGLSWIEGLYSEAGEQLTYMKAFFEQYDWWKLEPCFNGNAYYKPNGTNYSVATVGNDLYLGYFYGKSYGKAILGTLTGMKNGEYTVRWMNCRTGQYTQTETITVTDGTYQIPGKPDSGDYALAVEFKG